MELGLSELNSVRIFYEGSDFKSEVLLVQYMCIVYKYSFARQWCSTPITFSINLCVTQPL